MLKENNYITIASWMRTELNLKGTELLIFALIYGYSQDGESVFRGSLRYISEWCGITKQGVLLNLKSLTEQNLLIKEDLYINNIKYCTYKVNLEKLNSIKKILTPIKETLTPIKESRPNNIIDNIENNIDIKNKNTSYFSKNDESEPTLNKRENTEILDTPQQEFLENSTGYNNGTDFNNLNCKSEQIKEKPKKQTKKDKKLELIDRKLDKYDFSEEICDLILAYYEDKIETGKMPGDNQIDLCLNKLAMYPEDKQKTSLEKSIAGGWSSPVMYLEDEKNKGRTAPSFHIFPDGDGNHYKPLSKEERVEYKKFLEENGTKF